MESELVELKNATANALLEDYTESGWLDGVDKDERLTVAILLDNAKQIQSSNRDTRLSTGQVMWLTKQAWLRATFRKMVSVQAMPKSCSLAYYLEKSNMGDKKILSDGVGAKTHKYSFPLPSNICFGASEKMDMSEVANMYADLIAAELNSEIASKLPKSNIEALDGMPASLGGFKSFCDYIIGPDTFIDRAREKDNLEGVDTYHGWLMLDEYSFMPQIIAGRYPENSMIRPIFMPHLIVFDGPAIMPHGHMSVLFSYAWKE